MYFEYLRPRLVPPLRPAWRFAAGLVAAVMGTVLVLTLSLLPSFFPPRAGDDSLPLVLLVDLFAIGTGGVLLRAAVAGVDELSRASYSDPYTKALWTVAWGNTNLPDIIRSSDAELGVLEGQRGSLDPIMLYDLQRTIRRRLWDLEAILDQLASGWRVFPSSLEAARPRAVAYLTEHAARLRAQLILADELIDAHECAG